MCRPRARRYPLVLCRCPACRGSAVEPTEYRTAAAPPPPRRRRRAAAAAPRVARATPPVGVRVRSSRLSGCPLRSWAMLSWAMLSWAMLSLRLLRRLALACAKRVQSLRVQHVHLQRVSAHLPRRSLSASSF